MELKIALSILGIIIGETSLLLYIKSIFSGTSKPHTYSWLIWTITQSTAVFGLWYGGGGPGAWSLTIGTIFVFSIFLLSLYRGTKDITKWDTLTLIAALCAVLVWWQLHNPLLAVLMVSLIDFIGYMPQIRKAFSDPWSENILSWIGFTASNTCALLALTAYNALTMTYLLTLSLANIILIAVCLTRRTLIVKRKEHE